MINVENDNDILELYNTLLNANTVKKKYLVEATINFKVTFLVIENYKNKNNFLQIASIDYPSYDSVHKYEISYSFYNHSFLGKILSFTISTHYLLEERDALYENKMILLSDREFNESYNKTKLAYLNYRNKDDISDTLNIIINKFKDHNNIVNTIDDLH